MDGHSKPSTGYSQGDDSYLVCNDYRSLTRFLNTCPAAGTLTAFSMTLQSSVILQTRCKRWSCPHCGPRRIASLTKKVANAKPSKLVTLTIRPSDYESPRDAYDKTRRAISKLTGRIRRAVGEWEYLRILEVTKKGFPHYHLVVRGGYVSQQWLASEWESLTGAYIVDIRRIKNIAEAAKYVMKYLYKQKAISWTNRRVSWTKNFFLPDEDEKPEPLLLEEVQISGHAPDQYAYYELQGRTLSRIGADMWIIS